MFLANDREGKPSRIGWFLFDWSETSDVMANRGHRNRVSNAFLIVNLIDGTTNRTLFFTAHLEKMSSADIGQYFNVTRLKKGR